MDPFIKKPVAYTITANPSRKSSEGDSTIRILKYTYNIIILFYIYRNNSIFAIYYKHILTILLFIYMVNIKIVVAGHLADVKNRN